MFRASKLIPQILEPSGKIKPFAPALIFCPGSSRKQCSGNYVQAQQGRYAALLHKLNNTQKMFLYAHRNDTRFGLARITLNSKKPLPFDTLQQALLHLQSKNPVMQIGIRDHEGESWFYKLDRMKIEFKLFEEGTSDEEAIDFCFSGFDEVHGPLWRACLVPLPYEAPCADQETKKNYPHQCYLYVSTHHSIFDGMTVLSFFQPLTDIINDVIEGNKVNNSPMSVFVSSDEYEKAYLQIKEKLISEPNHLKNLKDMTLRSNQLSLFSKCFPRLEVSKPSTKFKVMDVNQEAMIKFIAKCKKMGITGSTGLQMIINTALVQLVQEAGYKDDSFTLNTNYTIDLRRYMKPRDLLIHGCHIEGAVSTITVDKHITKNFWRNCNDLNKTNVDILKNGKVVQQAIGRQLFLSQPPPEDFFKNTPKLTRDFGLNNLRTFDWVLQGRGKHVQLTEAKSCTCVHNFTFPFLVAVYDYRGVHTQVFTYSTEWLTEDMANVFVAKIRYLVEYFSRYD